eukprot:TRINITY_DN68462_c0_g1_i1.p1 TRINITY_DN68462_c0_g1~~TRINITY_DN68462_c0_g1_i1.p1  ORF type:complete len:403 (-),score=50.29 TRINITY_DN68462_c0_g1_i1:247-1455(-)
MASTSFDAQSAHHCFSLLEAGFEENTPQVERVELFGDHAFVLRNFLSVAECDDVIRQAESFGMCAPSEPYRMRLCERVKVMGEDLAGVLFKRAVPYLNDIQVRDSERPRGVPTDAMRGAWKPSTINPCFRVCRYDVGGFFLPHHDGDFVTNSRNRSLKTFMVYLNDDFDGGPTNFYDESQPHYAKADPEKVILSYKPERGSCLVFNHNITHDGGELRIGQKYIIRTEVLYEHCHIDDSDAVASNFMQRVASPESLPYCFGLGNTISALEHRAVDTILVWEDLDILRLQVKNSEASDDIVVKFSSPQSVNLPNSFIDPETGSILHIVGWERVVDWMKARLDDDTPLKDWQPGVKVVYISEQSKIGRQFVQGFGGIGALLLRPMSFQEPEDETTSAPDSDEDFA